MKIIYLINMKSHGHDISISSLSFNIQSIADTETETRTATHYIQIKQYVQNSDSIMFNESNLKTSDVLLMVLGFSIRFSLSYQRET